MRFSYSPALPQFVFALFLVFAAKGLLAEDRSPYKAMGAPADPRVVVRWNRFHDYTQSTNLLKRLAETYPDLAKLQSLGKSYGDRDMWVMTITDRSTGKADEKPAFWIDGGIHANEIQAVEVVLYTAWYLLEMHDQETVSRLLKERTFYLMPMMSPDSRDAHFYEANTTHSPRTGQRPFDDDRDGRLDEDPADDLDGDGQITQMRVKDENGRYKPHKDFPELMVRVEANEKGEYRLLGSEGFDNDEDGRVNEDGDGYYDPNRDWPWLWKPGYVQRGARKYPLAILENRMVSEFIAAHPNIAGAQSYHNAGGMILRGPGGKTDSFPGADLAVYDELARQGEKLLPQYRYMNIANDLYEVWGGEVDWLHQMRGIFAFTNELFTPFNFFREHQGDGGYFGKQETQFLFDKYLLFGEGVVKWHEVDHPQYGKVEVGGLKKNWLRQPPSFLLEEECHRNMAFTLYHADQMPLVKIQSVKVVSLTDTLNQVTVVVENDRIAPTHAAVDVSRKITRPDIVKIQGGEGSKVVLAMTSTEPYFRSAREQKRRPHAVSLANVAGRSVTYIRWLVEGEGPYKVTIDSVKGGRDEVEAAK